MAEPLLRVRNVGKRYCRELRRSLLYGLEDIGRECLAMHPHEGLRKNEFWANKDISFDLHRGECLGLIGSNGAGKSTLLKLIAGLSKPDEGSIEVNGRIGALIELGAGFNPLLSGRENIYINGAVLGMGKKEIGRKLDSILDFADIGEFIDAPVQSYSSGMKVRLGFAIAVHMEPDILLIDEVLAVGDTAFRMKCITRIQQILSVGTAVIFVSHDTIALQRIGMRGLVLKAGNVFLDGNLNDALYAYEARQENAFELVTVDEYSSTARALEDFQFQIKINTGTHAPARLLIRIDTQQNGPIWGRTFLFDQNSKEKRITVTLPNLPLLDGAYSVFFALYGTKTEDFLEQGVLFNFAVTGAPKSFFAKGAVGVLNLPIEFNYLAN